MPRGGHNAKPIVLYVLDGTYRKDRHGNGLAIEQRLRRPAIAWDFCGATMTDDFPLMTSMNGTGLICANCVAGAVLYYTLEGYDFAPFMDPDAPDHAELWNSRR